MRGRGPGAVTQLNVEGRDFANDGGLRREVSGGAFAEALGAFPWLAAQAGAFQSPAEMGVGASYFVSLRQSRAAQPQGKNGEEQGNRHGDPQEKFRPWQLTETERKEENFAGSLRRNSAPASPLVINAIPEQPKRAQHFTLQLEPAGGGEGTLHFIWIVLGGARFR